MPDHPDLTALLGSRICHDLISPLGAIGNGVELLLMSGGTATPEMALISESVSAANARIRFFRIAFGAAAADQRVGRPEIAGILADITRGARLAIDWRPEGDQARREVKLAFLALLCVEAAMPWGGTVTVTQAGRDWRLSGKAHRLRRDGLPWPILSAGAADPQDVSAAEVQFPLLRAEALRQGRPLACRIGEAEVAIAF